MEEEEQYDTPWEFLVRPDPLRASLAGPSSPPQEDRRRSSRTREEVTVERGVDRVQAEKRLEMRAVGDFLLRARSEGSVALSLRGSTAVLHIKLERVGEKWIVGEGPSFRSISSAIHYYRRHPLPIRGAEHLRLNSPVSPQRTASQPHSYLI